MKGVALIDGRSRPYFQGIERVLNSQQREALAQGVWQVLETIPDDFESFEFQFAGTQVYIHKLSQEQILLVLTHDNLIYPDYFDAFSRLRRAFSQDSSATMETFQRLLGARNTKVTPLDFSEVANGGDEPPSPVDTLGSDGMGLEDSLDDSGDLSSDEPPTLEIPTLEIPSGSADYAVAADTEITDISMVAMEPDAPANPARPEDDGDLPPTVLLDPEDSADDVPELPDFSATDAGLPDLDRADASLPDLGKSGSASSKTLPTATMADADSQAADAAALFAASLADANALVGRSSTKSSSAQSDQAQSEQATLDQAESDQTLELPALDGEDCTADALPEVDSLLAVTSPPAAQAPDAAAVRKAETQADLAALMDTLSLGEEDFDTQSGGAHESAAVTDAALPERESPGNLAPSETAERPQLDALDEPLLAVTQPKSSPGANPAAAEPQAEGAERSLNHQLDAVALDEDIEIDDLFGYEEPIPKPAPPQTQNAVLESYVESLNALGEFSAHYLGRAVIVNYWRTSRPTDEWLRGAFAIERSANSIRLGPDYAASRRSPISDGQQVALQTWAAQFVDRCSKVIRDFPQLVQQSLSEDQSKMLDL